MRLMQHPGPVLEPRLLIEHAADVTEFRVALPIATDLLDGLSVALAAKGIRSAGIRLAGGVLSRCRFVTGIPDPTGFRIATHSPAIDLAGPVLIVSGGAILGVDERDRSRIHCHAMFTGGDGEVRSGHLLPRSCPIAEPRFLVWVTPTGTARFESRFDEETNFPLMHPAPAP